MRACETFCVVHQTVSIPCYRDHVDAHALSNVGAEGPGERDRERETETETERTLP